MHKELFVPCLTKARYRLQTKYSNVVRYLIFKPHPIFHSKNEMVKSS